ncbi:MAG: helix-turn-helix domain-containing protein [Rhodospirillales bacterium]|jgi:DNA-binding XRE family transcriptional regulator
MTGSAATDRVVLTRAEYDALLDRIEDAEDRASLAEHRADVRARGTTAVVADALPVEAVERLLAGEHPVRIWREHRGLTARALAERAGLSAADLSEIETGTKRGSVDAVLAIVKLARALDISVEDVVQS